MYSELETFAPLALDFSIKQSTRRNGLYLHVCENLKIKKFVFCILMENFAEQVCEASYSEARAKVKSGSIIRVIEPNLHEVIGLIPYGFVFYQTEAGKPFLEFEKEIAPICSYERAWKVFLILKEVK